MKNHNIFQKALLTLFTFVFLQTSYAEVGGWVDDATITAEIKAAYILDPALSAWDITVTTTDGNVKLGGHANSKTQLEAAVSVAAQVPGVKDVDTSELTVEHSIDPVKDYTISAKIKGKLLLDHINPLKVDVESVNGNVYLSGKVKKAEDETTAIAIAKDTKHVESVTSFLRIKDHH